MREKLGEYRIEFERNIKYFSLKETVKKEIDIVIYNRDQSERYAIELKYPQNGQYPEQMFSFIKDIHFMEELKKYGFQATYCLTLVKDKNFYSGKKQDGIYAYFRASKPIKGEIIKPTGKKNEKFSIDRTYIINWYKCADNKMYYILEI